MNKRVIPLNKAIEAFIMQTWTHCTLDNMEQAAGRWIDEHTVPERCCFGARVAKAYNLKDEQGFYYFLDGEKKMAEELECSIIQVNFALWTCGAPKDPFDLIPWIIHPKEVMEHLKHIEWVPSTDNCNLIMADALNRDIKEIYEKICMPTYNEATQLKLLEKWIPPLKKGSAVS